ncbi:MAG: DUF4412 domain-containing protein [Halofilum sp. (in: g-proteobacteria)]|nr:DUF4412 domain-containing protein [Halofilum sp. (in: g-proteobacteria)]
MKAPLALLAAISLATGTAAADTRMSYSTPGGSSPQIAIKGDQIRMEGSDRGRGITLFDASSRQMTVIDPSKRNYYRMDAESMKQQGRQMSEQMRQMREQMEKQLENMPEEQRKMMRKQMEQMMPDQPAASAGGEVRFESSGESARVAGIACEISTVYREGEPIQRVCIASPGSLGMSSGDRDTLRSLFSFLQEMASSFGGAHMGAQVPAKMMETFDGVPIRSEDLQGQKSWTLRNVETGNIDAAEFSIPSGYTEVEPFSMNQ